MTKYKHQGSVHLFKKEPKTTIGDVLGGIVVIFIILMVIGAIFS